MKRRDLKILFKQRGCLKNCLAFNICILCILLFIHVFRFIDYRNVELKNFFNEAAQVSELINRDIILLDSFLSFNQEKGKVVPLDPFLRKTLKICKPNYIFVTKSFVDKSNITASLVLSQISALEFVLSKVITTNDIAIQITGRFDAGDLGKNIKMFVKSNIELTSISQGKNTNEYQILHGDNFIFSLKLNSITLKQFLLGVEKSIFLFNMLFLTLFNCVFIYFFGKEKNLTADILEYYKMHEDLYFKEQEMSKSLRRALNLVEGEAIKMMEEFSNTVRQAILGFKILSAVNFKDASCKMVDILTRIDIDHLNDPAAVAEIDLLTLIDKAVYLNDHLLKQNQISLVKNIPSEAFVMCNELVLMKAVSSLLYWAIVASGERKIIGVNIKREGHNFALEIHDNGYRVFPDNNFSSPFKLPIEELEKLLPKYSITLDVKEKDGKGAVCSLRVPIARKKYIQDHDNVVYLHELR